MMELAGEIRSDARVASEGPALRGGKKTVLARNDRGGQAPALRLSRPSPFIVGRGPVPRHRSRYQKPSLRSFRSLMSIAADMQKALRSFRSLMCFDMPRVFIKVLRTLTT